MRSKFKWIFTLLLALSVQLSFAQEKTVTGVVSDATGPIPGANVVVQGTTRGTQTDIDGKYSISAKPGDVLVFSYVGMSDFTATVGAANTINATLQEGLMLTEVVVTGALGIRRSRDAVTSSQQTVKAAEITQAAQPNAVLALVGKVTGLQINQTNSAVQGSTRFVLRGNRSLTGDNQALVVIDNAISSLEVFSSIAPELIESVNVIKGPQGAALYGEQGRNGAVIVTTKRGTKSGKVAVNIVSSVDFEEVAQLPQRQRRYGQGWSGTHVTYENGAWGAEFDGVVRPTGLAQADGTYIMAPYSSIKDNIKDFFETGTVRQNSVSINAGDENGYAVFSANHLGRDFVVDKDALNRSTFMFKGGKKMGRWSVDGNVQYITSKSETTTSTLYEELLQAATNIPIGRFSTPRNEYHWTSYYRSPYWTRDNIRNENRADNVRMIGTLNYKLNENINFNYLVSGTIADGHNLSYTNEYIDLLKVGGGDNTTLSAFDASNSTVRAIYADFLANFDYDLTDKVGLKFNVGNNVQDTYASFTSVGGDNLTIPGFYNITNITGIPRVGNSWNRRRAFSFFANVDLSYDDYLFLNLTGRNDWSSTFAEGNNSYFYPSAGLSFVPTKAFAGLENNDILNYAKIAVSWVRNGNGSSVGFYDINDVYGQGFGFPFGTLNSFVPDTSVTDAGVRPEFYTTTDVTVNLEFFKSRLNLDFSAYRTQNSDLITNIQPSYASGVISSRGNIGETTVNGLEIDLGFTPIDNRDLDLRWTNKIGYSRAITTVDKVTDQTNSVALANFPGTSGGVGIFAEVGEEFPLIKGIGYQRDDLGRVIVDPATGLPLKTNEYIKLGKATPDYILNYSTAIDFKGFTLAAVMDYRTGHQFFSDMKQWLSWSGHLYESAVTGRTGFIFPNSAVFNDVTGQYEANNNVVTGGTTYGSYLSYFQDEYANTSENFVLDATAFKVREISLSYTFKRELIERAGMSALRIGVNARNPFMILPEENRQYSDPEQNYTTGNAQGIAARGQYPLTRTFGFSVNVTF